MTSYLDIFGNQTIPPSEAAYIRHTITADGQLVWPYNFSGDDLLSADITELSTATAGLSVRMPPANEVSVGQDILIRNVGVETITIRDFDGNVITTVAAGSAKYFYVTDNLTDAGVWAVFTYGTGTSGADASALAGYGLQPNGSNKLQVFSDYRGVNSDTTIAVADRAKVIEVTTGSITLTLPQASVAGNGYAVMIRNSSAGNALVEGFGTEEIDGLLNKTLFPNESAIFICNGTYWITVGYGRDTTFVFSEIVVNAALTNITLSSGDVAGRMIRVSGTATGNVTITLPSVDNIYFVNVESGVGLFSVTFKTSGVGSTVSLFADQNTSLYCDGTNVTTAINTILVSTLALADGSALAPSLRFSLDLTTGLFRSGTGQVSVSSGGVEVARFTANGLEIGAVAEYTEFTPVGSIVSTNVQDAIEEVAVDAATNLNDHITDPTAAHAASAIANTPAGSIAATDVQTAINELDTEKVPRTGTTASAVIPAGTTAQRDVSPIDGYIRYNSTLQQFEGYFNGNWQSVGGGQLLGNAVVKAIFYNAQTISENLTVAASTNGLSAGPVAIADGFTVTVSDGSVWTVV